MQLLFRQFRSRSGLERLLLAALRDAAAGMIRHRQANAVLVCQRSDATDHLLWIEHRGGSAGQEETAGQPSLTLPDDLIEGGGAPLRAEFVDGFYHFPLPPCRVWGLETRCLEVARTLLNLPALASSNPQVAGLSFYRVGEEPTRTIAFLALAPGVTPGDYLESRPDCSHEAQTGGTDLVYYPLTVRWTVGRLTPGRSPAASLVRYPRGAFWARLALSAATVASPEGRFETTTAQRSGSGATNHREERLPSRSATGRGRSSPPGRRARARGSRGTTSS